MKNWIANLEHVNPCVLNNYDVLLWCIAMVPFMILFVICIVLLIKEIRK
jgi:hypothetical protein